MTQHWCEPGHHSVVAVHLVFLSQTPWQYHRHIQQLFSFLRKVKIEKQDTNWFEKATHHQAKFCHIHCVLHDLVWSCSHLTGSSTSMSLLQLLPQIRHVNQDAIPATKQPKTNQLYSDEDNFYRNDDVIVFLHLDPQLQSSRPLI